MTLTHSTEPFTEEEKDAIFRFLGYPNWRSIAPMIALGVPSASQAFYVAFDAVHRVQPESRARIRLDVERALEVECQIEDTGRLKASRVAEVTMNSNEFRDLLERLKYWCIRIADALGVTPNPASMQMQMGNGGINGRVIS